MRHILPICAFAAFGLTALEPAVARVQEETENGFVVQLGVDVPASPDDVWEELVHPERWWNDANTFSGDAANLTLDPRAGGCFCEVLPGDDAPKGAPRGGAEHMRVIYVETPRALRMAGALGPLQPDPVTGILTMVLQKTDTGTRVMWEYAVSGRVRKPDMAAAMDAVLTSQIVGLGEKLGARIAPRKHPDAEDEAAYEPAKEADDTDKPDAKETDKPDAKDGAKTGSDEAEAPDEGEEKDETGKGEAKSAKSADGNSDEADGEEADGEEVADSKADLSDEGDDEKPAKGKDDKAKVKPDKPKDDEGVLSEEGDDDAEAEKTVKDKGGKAMSENAGDKVDEWVLFDEEEDATEPVEPEDGKKEKAKAKAESNKGKAKADGDEPGLTKKDKGDAEADEAEAKDDEAKPVKPAKDAGKSPIIGR